MTRKKHFIYKGQQVNYYNKVKKNPKVTFCIMYLDATEGYVVEWRY